MLLVALGIGLPGCSGDPGYPDDYAGGSGGSAGMPGGTGGTTTSGGSTNPGAGGSTFGGMATSGGASSGGATAGGSSSGGFAGGGGANGGATGGTATGGVSTGGASTGGTSNGGSTSGGTSSGGVAGSGGKSTTGGSAGASGGGGKGGTVGAGGTPSTGGAAGNTGTGGGVCTGTIPAPPTDMKQTIDITWKEMTGGFSGMKGARDNSRRIQTYKSWALDHVMWGQGNLNFCIRWDSTVTVTATMRDQMQTTLQRGVDAWFSALYGYDCFPYPKVNVKVTGWAVANRATLGWTDEALVPIYVNQIDPQDRVPTCPATCSRFAHQDKNYTFAQCPGGAQNRFDQFVWLDEGYTMPNGWDMGAHVNQADFTATLSGTGLYHIWLHEFGHGIGFPDYYDWSTWAPGVTAPACVMNAGRAVTVTDWDKWMFKRTWSELLRMNRWP